MRKRENEEPRYPDRHDCNTEEGDYDDVYKDTCPRDEPKKVDDDGHGEYGDNDRYGNEMCPLWKRGALLDCSDNPKDSCKRE